MKSTLIIARYNEDITWLNDKSEHKIIIYNKGNKLLNNKFKNIISLPNVGRESHTWLHHITNNYENLDENNIFLQGRIDDLNCMAFKDPKLYYKDLEKYGFAVSRFGLLGPMHWKDNVGIEKNKKYSSQWEANKIGKSEIGFRKFAKSLFPNIPLLVATSYGGCFAVKKELIRNYDLEFYKKLLFMLSNHEKPIEGHFMERLWCYMFTKNSRLKHSLQDVFITKFERLILKNNFISLNPFFRK